MKKILLLTSGAIFLNCAFANAKTEASESVNLLKSSNIQLQTPLNLGEFNGKKELTGVDKDILELKKEINRLNEDNKQLGRANDELQGQLENAHARTLKEENGYQVVEWDGDEDVRTEKGGSQAPTLLSAPANEASVSSSSIAPVQVIETTREKLVEKEVENSLPKSIKPLTDTAISPKEIEEVKKENEGLKKELDKKMGFGGGSGKGGYDSDELEKAMKTKEAQLTAYQQRIGEIEELLRQEKLPAEEKRRLESELAQLKKLVGHHNDLKQAHDLLDSTKKALNETENDLKINEEKVVKLIDEKKSLQSQLESEKSGGFDTLKKEIKEKEIEIKKLENEKKSLTKNLNKQRIKHEKSIKSYKKQIERLGGETPYIEKPLLSEDLIAILESQVGGSTLPSLPPPPPLLQMLQNDGLSAEARMEELEKRFELGVPVKFETTLGDKTFTVAGLVKDSNDMALLRQQIESEKEKVDKAISELDGKKTLDKNAQYVKGLIDKLNADIKSGKRLPKKMSDFKTKYGLGITPTSIDLGKDYGNNKVQFFKDVEGLKEDGLITSDEYNSLKNIAEDLKANQETYKRMLSNKEKLEKIKQEFDKQALSLENGDVMLKDLSFSQKLKKPLQAIMLFKSKVASPELQKLWSKKVKDDICDFEAQYKMKKEAILKQIDKRAEDLKNILEKEEKLTTRFSEIKSSILEEIKLRLGKNYGTADEFIELKKSALESLTEERIKELFGDSYKTNKEAEEIMKELKITEESRAASVFSDAYRTDADVKALLSDGKVKITKNQRTGEERKQKFIGLEKVASGLEMKKTIEEFFKGAQIEEDDPIFLAMTFRTEQDVENFFEELIRGFTGGIDTERGCVKLMQDFFGDPGIRQSDPILKAMKNKYVPCSRELAKATNAKSELQGDASIQLNGVKITKENINSPRAKSAMQEGTIYRLGCQEKLLSVVYGQFFEKLKAFVVEKNGLSQFKSFVRQNEAWLNDKLCDNKEVSKGNIDKFLMQVMGYKASELQENADINRSFWAFAKLLMPHCEEIFTDENPSWLMELTAALLPSNVTAESLSKLNV